VSGCVGRPGYCFSWGPIMLLRRPCAVLTWMKSYLNNRTQHVAVGSVVSNAMHLQCGVPQSSVLGSRLYCIFAKPISEICWRHNFSHHSYADDTQVYLVIKPLYNWKNISRRLETCLSDVSVWMSSNILKLNHNKTELIVFAPKPEMNSLWKFLRKMFRLIFLELLIVILCKLLRLTALHVF
jgi:hypothetical protein